MHKLAHDQVANHFYNLGVQGALGHTKIAGLKHLAINPTSLRRLLSGGVEDSLMLGAVLGERRGGQMGTLAGAFGGSALGAGLGVAADSTALAALLGGAGAVGGGALGNLVGRPLGAGIGGATGAVNGLEPFRTIGNFLADPLRRVPGIRG